MDNGDKDTDLELVSRAGVRLLLVFRLRWPRKLGDLKRCTVNTCICHWESKRKVTEVVNIYF